MVTLQSYDRDTRVAEFNFTDVTEKDYLPTTTRVGIGTASMFNFTVANGSNGYCQGDGNAYMLNGSTNAWAVM